MSNSQHLPITPPSNPTVETSAEANIGKQRMNTYSREKRWNLLDPSLEQRETQIEELKREQRNVSTSINFFAGDIPTVTAKVCSK